MKRVSLFGNHKWNGLLREEALSAALIIIDAATNTGHILIE